MIDKTNIVNTEFIAMLYSAKIHDWAKSTIINQILKLSSSRIK